MQIFKSRFTPKATGDEVCLEKGEKVKYKLKDGSVIDIIIDSERMTHKNCKTYGYEAVFLDDKERYFADGKRIIWWKGKMDSVQQLDNAMKKL